MATIFFGKYQNFVSRALTGTGLIGCLLFFFCSCTPADIHRGSSCKRCHHNVTLDAPHDIRCTDCHKGNNQALFKEKAHEGLVKDPASPDNAKDFCGQCHPSQVKNVTNSIHYTLKNEISLLWGAFFPSQQSPSIKEITGISKPTSPGQLLEDLLARRCLRCHVYYEGDNYKGTRRGKGCAACHMPVKSKRRHYFRAPSMENCLSCHYANFVGWDYAGRFEKDYPEDFRAPLQKGKPVKRPYGVEWIRMTPDVHFMAGMTCVDCHKRNLFHPGKKEPSISCRDCHSNLTAISGHIEDSDSKCKVDCQTCHALWSVWDQGRWLMRQDAPDLEEWQFLAVQGSSEVEQAVSRYADALDASFFKPVMSDKIHGQDFIGMWFAGFEKRRWAPVILGKNQKGTLSVMRPLLDLTLSYVDKSGETVLENIRARSKNPFDLIYPEWLVTDKSLKAKAPLCLPYHPHTISRADAIRSIFVKKYLDQCSREAINQKIH